MLSATLSFNDPRPLYLNPGSRNGSRGPLYPLQRVPWPPDPQPWPSKSPLEPRRPQESRPTGVDGTLGTQERTTALRPQPAGQRGVTRSPGTPDVTPAPLRSR